MNNYNNYNKLTNKLLITINNYPLITINNYPLITINKCTGTSITDSKTVKHNTTKATVKKQTMIQLQDGASTLITLTLSR